jgi:hypothetical protein
MEEVYTSDFSDQLIAKWKDLVIGKQTAYMGESITYVEIIKIEVGNNLFEVKVRDNRGVFYQLSFVVHQTDLINYK